ncbi:hypothetical protein A3A05_00980 [Candidatus Nomurabacteria bacterium RIFCSPLOWO2_01_FULL_41_12]|uniref:DUF4367 domain-containing protein n=1 Tax=Candidatus Nomurabacteria bacterium RIFCSPLOWO2_01_FULL_41_12 TaxID=1801774 RepID=A0A1F6WX30_9BACT|nr:MAG: hypothetical protein A2732_01965 [Candidatus Nomurabacteria bacterium RIFCSPHIGHO2_01_FULL_40_10]OGI86432.1 MAG: hypothetical protein A3A05_00980 [Candidatus Nomurabacteria bacterium RIFCSPLOWO2_01_FULL_41_12]
MKNKEKDFASVLIVIVVVIILGVTGYFTWLKKSNRNTPKSLPSAVLQVDISNWKTYTNTKYGFEFNYPDNFKVILDEDTSHEDFAVYTIKLYDSKTKAHIEVDLTNNKFDISNMKTFAPTGNVNAPEKMAFNQNIFYYYGPGGGGVYYPDRYLYDYKGRILEFVFAGPWENDKTPSAQTKQIEKEMLNSFKLIK